VVYMQAATLVGSHYPASDVKALVPVHVWYHGSTTEPVTHSPSCHINTTPQLHILYHRTIVIILIKGSRLHSISCRYDYRMLVRGSDTACDRFYCCYSRL
jgi:hypothetical protein